MQNGYDCRSQSLNATSLLAAECFALITVLLVDDHELVRAGIRRILEDIKGLVIAGEACCGEDAVKWCRANQVDVILMDMNMPGIGGLEATRKIVRYNPDIKIIMLTIHTENPCRQKSCRLVPQVISVRAQRHRKW